MTLCVETGSTGCKEVHFSSCKVVLSFNLFGFMDPAIIWYSVFILWWPKVRNKLYRGHSYVVTAYRCVRIGFLIAMNEWGQIVTIKRGNNTEYWNCDTLRIASNTLGENVKRQAREMMVSQELNCAPQVWGVMCYLQICYCKSKLLFYLFRFRSVSSLR